MNVWQRNLEQVWKQLRGQKPQRPHYLEEVHLTGLRGIADLRVSLPFPVTVLAGANGCGKSTALFALACAYASPESGGDAFTPAKLFADFRPRKDEEANRFFAIRTAGAFTDAHSDVTDPRPLAEMTYAYVVDHERPQMKWTRGRERWKRGFLGRRGAVQPSREVYLRTLANLTNPSERRGVLQIAARPFDQATVDVELIALAQRILSWRYQRLAALKSKAHSLLFAARADEAGLGARYSEFHMSAGERAILRLSMDLSAKQDALVLIDEVEAGLHPALQKQLMLELQRLALRNRLQVVVTTHSASILDAVPEDARIFLQRSAANVVRCEPYRDVIQKALYGESQTKLFILCEDKVAEGFVRGILDFLGPRLDLTQHDIRVGRDTGKDQFPAHLDTFALFKMLADVIFVIDGDGRDIQNLLQERSRQVGQATTVLCLPGSTAPEIWAWELIHKHTERYTAPLGLSEPVLEGEISRLNSLFDAAADTPSAIAKGKFNALAEFTSRSEDDLMRLVAKTEASLPNGDVSAFARELENAVQHWRSAIS